MPLSQFKVMWLNNTKSGLLTVSTDFHLGIKAPRSSHMALTFPRAFGAMYLADRKGETETLIFLPILKSDTNYSHSHSITEKQSDDQGAQNGV